MNSASAKVLDKEIRKYKSVDNIRYFKEEVKDMTIDSTFNEIRCFRICISNKNIYFLQIRNEKQV